MLEIRISQPANLQKKQQGGEFSGHLTLYFECQFNKNSLLHSESTFLPAENVSQNKFHKNQNRRKPSIFLIPVFVQAMDCAEYE